MRHDRVAHRAHSRGRSSNRRRALQRLDARTRASTCHGALARRCATSASCARVASIPGGTRRLTRARTSGGARRRCRPPVGNRCPARIPTASPTACQPRLRRRAARHRREARHPPGTAAADTSDTGPPLVCVEPVNRRVPAPVMERGEHRDHCGERVGCRAAEHAGVHRPFQCPDGDRHVRQPTQRRRQGRHADREVPCVTDEDRICPKQVGVLGDERFEAARALLLRAFG